MHMAQLGKALLVWLGILILAIANGLLREELLLPTLGQVPAYLLSGILLSLFILVVTWAALPWLALRQTRHLVALGAGWLVLTLVFEFAFGFAQGKALTELLEAYKFKDGNIWPLVLLVTAGAPWVAGKLRGH